MFVFLAVVLAALYGAGRRFGWPRVLFVLWIAAMFYAVFDFPVSFFIDLQS